MKNNLNTRNWIVSI